MKSSKGAKAGEKKAGAAVWARIQAQAAPPARYGSPRRLVCSRPPRVGCLFRSPAQMIERKEQPPPPEIEKADIPRPKAGAAVLFLYSPRRMVKTTRPLFS